MCGVVENCVCGGSFQVAQAIFEESEVLFGWFGTVFRKARNGKGNFETGSVGEGAHVSEQRLVERALRCGKKVVGCC